jgi:hypothetical protein
MTAVPRSILPFHVALRMSPFGTSRQFAALQNLAAIGGIADIEQAAPMAR